MDDISLVRRAQKGDVNAFNELAQRWQGAIHRFVYGFFGNSDDAGEITQKTLIRVYRKVGDLEDPDRFSSWIYRIAKNLCLDELKRAGRKRSVPLNGEEMQIADSASRTPAGQLENRELGEIIQDALILLPDDQRIVIVLKEFEGMKFREIADILEEPENTIKTRMYTGLRSLRNTLTKWNIPKEYLNHE
jgi:RNA polymerase sigma-70 factor (ECF subfamily)